MSGKKSKKIKKQYFGIQKHWNIAFLGASKS